MDDHGYGMSSVQFICGTTDLHKKLERKIARFFNTEDTILYAACFACNGGVFEPLLTGRDAIISDALNHASIIDRCPFRARHRDTGMRMPDMEDLEKQLRLGAVTTVQAYRYRVEYFRWT